jgi:hypothetical protein
VENVESRMELGEIRKLIQRRERPVIRFPEVKNQRTNRFNQHTRKRKREEYAKSGHQVRH